MTEKPQPLVADEVNLRDFPYLPLDAARLRDSDMVTQTSAEEFRTAILLWCASWHQLPAGSLPLDDTTLAQLAGYGRSPGGMKDWRKVRRGALRGFEECSDNRFYHPVIAEKVNEAWLGKLRLRHKRELDRIKKAAQRGRTEPDYPNFDEWNAHRLSQGTDHFAREGQVPNVPGTVPGTDGGSPPIAGCDVPKKLAQKGERGKGKGERGKGIEEETDQPAGDDEPNIGSVGPLACADVSLRLVEIGIPFHRLERQVDRDRISSWVRLRVDRETLNASIVEAHESKPLQELSTGYLDPIVRRRVLLRDNPAAVAPTARVFANGAIPRPPAERSYSLAELGLDEPL